MTRTLLTAIFLTLFTQTASAGNSIDGKGLFCPCVRQYERNCESPQIFEFVAGNWNHICINVTQDIAIAEKCGENRYFSDSSMISSQLYKLDRSNLDLYFHNEKIPRWKCNRMTSSADEFDLELQQETNKRQKLYDKKLRDKKI